jgi:hypothetical protein
VQEGGAALVICDICGETYDERTYQVVVPVLRASFDKIECAERALQRHLREAKRPALEQALFEEVERLREQLRELRATSTEAGPSIPLASGEAAEGD